jgi:hypothetical protein
MCDAQCMKDLNKSIANLKWAKMQVRSPSCACEKHCFCEAMCMSMSVCKCVFVSVCAYICVYTCVFVCMCQ